MVHDLDAALADATRFHVDGTLVAKRCAALDEAYLRRTRNVGGKAKRDARGRIVLVNPTLKQGHVLNATKVQAAFKRCPQGASKSTLMQLTGLDSRRVGMALGTLKKRGLVVNVDGDFWKETTR